MQLPHQPGQLLPVPHLQFEAQVLHHLGDALDLPHTYPWRVTNQEALPKEGWAHDDGCDCRSCRRPQAQSGAGADERPR